MEDHNNRSPPPTFRTYQILPHTNSYFHRLYSSLDLLPPGAPGVPYCLLLCFFLFSYLFQLVLVLVLRMYCMDSMV